MTIRIGHILPKLALGVAVLSLSACDKAEQSAGDSFLRIMGVSIVPPVASAPVQSLAAVAPAEPVECVVPALLFRTMQCDEQGNLIPIR